MLQKKMLGIRDDEVKAALGFGINQIEHVAPQFTDCFPSPSSENLFYKPMENIGWTNGFWTGELWLAYEYGKSEKLKEIALQQVESFYNRILEKVNVNHHDMGFLYSLSCVAAYKLVGSEKAKNAALMAADHLIQRYQPRGEFIQAWGDLGKSEDYRLIIDCLLNLPLLYWAYEISGKEEYKYVAQKHIHTTMKCIFREDYSAYHTYFFDNITGLPSHGASHQGYRNGSAWARGQAWGIYGCALAYKYTKEESYIKIFYKITEFYLQHLPDDLIPYWDLEFGRFAEQPKDSSAATIVVCGMLEMAKYLNQEEAERYQTLAKQMLKSLYDNYAVKSSGESNGLLKHGTYAKSSPYNTCNDCGVDECTIWGDYFYLEALTRVYKDWELYW